MGLDLADVTTFDIELDGTQLPDDLADQLVRATVEQSLVLPDAFSLTFHDPACDVLRRSKVKIGSDVKISAVTPQTVGGEPLIRDAEVTALEAEYGPEGTLTIVRGMDRSFRAWGGSRVACYPNSTLSDAVRQVAGQMGLKLGRIDSTATVYSNLTQNNLSDWAFIRSLARQAGYDAWIGDGKLNFCAPTEAASGPDPGRLDAEDPLQLVPRQDLLSYRCALTAGQQVKEVQVRGWDPSNKKAVVASAQAASSSAAVGLSPGDLAGKLANSTYLSVRSPVSMSDEAEQTARTLAAAIGGASAIFEGVAVGNPKLKAGVAVSLGLLGEPFDGKYTLSEAHHLLDGDGYRTWFAVDGRSDRSLLGLVSQGGGEPELLGGGRIDGVVPAVVTNNKDPEDQCRVKVKFPWLSDDYESDWARNTQVWAGKSYGSVVIPEVNDEVLVAFEQGDIHRPFVLGGLYNGVDRPKERSDDLIDSSGAVGQRTLVSRSGHRIALLEEEGKRDGVWISTAGDGYKLELSKKDRKVTLEADGSIVIEAKGSGNLSVKAAGNLQITGRKIDIKAQSGVTIDGGTGPVEAKSTSKVGLQAPKLDLNGSANTDLKGGALVNIQGALVKIN